MFYQNYRNEDHITSKLAGEQMEASGESKRLAKICLRIVRENPGNTAREIEGITGIKAHKRLPELRRKGLVINGEDRRCRISGRPAMTWLIAESKTNGVLF